MEGGGGWGLSGQLSSGGGRTTPLPEVCIPASVTGLDLEVPSGLESEKGTPWAGGSWGRGYRAPGMTGQGLGIPLAEWLPGLAQEGWGLQDSSGPGRAREGLGGYKGEQSDPFCSSTWGCLCRKARGAGTAHCQSHGW